MQPKSKSKRRLWSVIVTIHVGDYLKRYCHINVVKCYQDKSGTLYVIEEKKKIHRYDMRRVESIQVREYRRDIIQ